MLKGSGVAVQERLEAVGQVLQGGRGRPRCRQEARLVPQVIPPVPSLLTLLRPYLAHFPPVFSPFFARFHRRRGGSNKPQAGTQGQEQRQKMGERWDTNGQNAKTKIAARKRVEGMRTKPPKVKLPGLLPPSPALWATVSVVLCVSQS